MVIVDLLGRQKVIGWDGITEVKTRPMTRKLTFYVHDEPYSVNGKMSEYRKFVSLANRKISPLIASDTLGMLDSQLKSGQDKLNHRRKL